ncbi:GntR family transcriptional regulator [Kribbella sp. NPDC005582]|uniref:GntR family transcriptional regulator n=1 Tax=Kribbella sp. NPDC005582 TaxID=3156893 RepID=UPI0033B9876C
MSEQSMVSPARRRGLADEVADRIREAIFTGAYPPGAQLREVELSGVMDVSRGPVREGLRILEREGLVRCAWHRGATVITLSAADVTELHTLRGALEDLAVRHVVDRASDSDLDSLAKTAAAMERADDPHEMVRCDIAFHDAVFAAAGHQRLAEAWDAIRCQVHLFLLTRINVSVEGYLGGIPREHQELVTALRTRDADAALALFAVHRHNAFDILTAGTDEASAPTHR